MGPGIVDLFAGLAGAAGKVAADAWTIAMLGLWNAGLWVMRLVLNLMDAFLTPDLSADGPLATVYQATFWVAGTFVVTMAMVQLGVAAVRRDGKSLATVLVGTGQFVIVWAGWVVYGVAVVAACGGLTRALMQTLLSVQSWSQWQPWQLLSVGDVIDATVATVLGLMGLLLWLAAIGHLLVMLTRAGALMVLIATTPISAAGLVSEAGRSWFWKSLRWFHAAAFTPVLMVLVLGLGVQVTTGVATGLTDSAQTAVGTALPGVILILVGTVSPLALFKLLAFVDPGSPSGAALRAGLSAQGGIQGLLSGKSSSTSGSATSGAASSTDGHGRSQAETAGEASTSARFGQAERGLLGLAGPVGGLAAQGLGLMQAVGAKGAAIGADVTNQTGAGHQSWHPDFGGMPASRRPGSGGGSGGGSGPADRDDPDSFGGDSPAGGGAPGGAATPMPAPPAPPAVGSDPALPTAARSGPRPAAPGKPGGAGAAPGGAAPASGGAAAGGAASTPIVPV